MALLKRNKRIGYDNISLPIGGSAQPAGAERIVANDTGGDEGDTTVIHERLVTSADGTNTSTSTQMERLVAGVSDYTSVFMERPSGVTAL